MHFDLTPEQQALRHAAREFMRRECPPEVTRQAIAEAFAAYLVRGLLRDPKGNGACTST